MKKIATSGGCIFLLLLMSLYNLALATENGPTKYSYTSKEWIKARTVVIKYCESRKKDETCKSALPDLKQSTKGHAKAIKECLPNLVINDKTAIFTSWNCNGGVEAELDLTGKYWKVKSVKFEASGD